MMSPSTQCRTNPVLYYLTNDVTIYCRTNPVLYYITNDVTIYNRMNQVSLYDKICHHILQYESNIIIFIYIIQSIKDTTDTVKSASYLDLHLEIDNEGRLETKLYDKRDYFSFPIVNFRFLSSNIQAAPSYGVYISPN